MFVLPLSGLFFTFTFTQLETHYFNTFVKDEIYHFTAGNIRKHKNPD